MKTLPFLYLLGALYMPSIFLGFLNYTIKSCRYHHGLESLSKDFKSYGGVSGNAALLYAYTSHFGNCGRVVDTESKGKNRIAINFSESGMWSNFRSERLLWSRM